MGGKRESGTQWWVWRMTWKVEGCYWGTAVGRKRGAEGKSRRHGKLSKFTFISARICFKCSSCPHWTFAVWTPSTTGRNKTALLRQRWWRWTPGHRQAAALGSARSTWGAPCVPRGEPATSEALAKAPSGPACARGLVQETKLRC